MGTIQSINPYTQEIHGEFELLNDEQIDAKIQKAHEAFLSWKITPNSEKKKLFLHLADIIDAQIEDLAKLQTQEMGMLYTASTIGLRSTTTLIRWFAQNFEEILKDEVFDEDGTQWKIIYDPLWVIFWVAPWNFPYNQVLRAAIPNILAGNTTVYKHASNVPLCAQKLEDLFKQAWFPEWVYTNLFITSSQTEKVMTHKHIRGTNLTWWEGAWRSIWSLAWKSLLPSVLELGWNDAFIVLEVEDLDSVVRSAVGARISNGGQRCNSSKRFIVLEKYYDAFCEKMAKVMSQLIIGDPMESTTQLPPLAKKDLVIEIDRQVKATISQGAKLLTWGKILEGKSNFYAPTVLAWVTRTMTSYTEEVFGPVASIIKSKSIEESITIANDSDFGLCGCVYGKDIDLCKKVASQIETGMIFINSPAASKPNLPFGWVKKSGYGKENGADGLKAFTNKKVIVYPS
jgi:succinate-semialdehyde dehydrogenase / glutarate-semialdehyde dehydrogenase